MNRNPFVKIKDGWWIPIDRIGGVSEDGLVVRIEFVGVTEWETIRLTGEDATNFLNWLRCHSSDASSSMFKPKCECGAKECLCDLVVSDSR